MTSISGSNGKALDYWVYSLILLLHLSPEVVPSTDEKIEHSETDLFGRSKEEAVNYGFLDIRKRQICLCFDFEFICTEI